MEKRRLVLLFGFTFCLEFFSGVVSESISKPTDCDRRETWFKPGKSYIYTYVAVAESNFVGTTQSKSALKFECDVQLNIPRKCEAILQVSECTLYERSPGSDDIYTELPSSVQFSEEISRHPVYYKFNKGEVQPDSIVVFDDEPLYIVNIKRGIISALQLKKQEWEAYQHPNQQSSDLFGSCPITYKTTPENNIDTVRDITSCLVPQIYQLQTKLFSFIKTLYGGYKEDHVSEPFYPFRSNIACQYLFNDEKQIENVNCLQQQAFRPTEYYGNVYATAEANVSQSLELTSVTELSSRRFNRDMTGRRTVGIHFEYEENVPAVVTQSQLLDQLHVLVDTFTASNLELLPGQFHLLVRQLRETTSDTLRQTMMSIWDCHGSTGEQCNSKHQMLEKDYYLDGLLSCGTTDCVSEFTHCLQQGHVSWFTDRYFMYDIALNHDASLQVISGILDLCKTGTRLSCWLPLGIMINKISTSDIDISQEDGPVYQTLLYMRQLIGDNCEPGILESLPSDRQMEEVDQLVLIIKTLGNIGQPIQTVFDLVNMESKQLVSAMLECAKNTQIPQKVSKAAIKALKKLEVDLQVQDSLFEILGDINREPVVRTSAFSRLLVEPDGVIASQLLDLVHQEPMDYMRTYMVASIQNMLENDQPDLSRLRMLWQQTIQEDGRQLPSIPDFLFGKSRYMELSRYFKLPLSLNMSGIQIKIDIVYDPASPVLQSAVIKLSYYYGVKHDIIELGVDIEGLDVLLDAIVGKKGMGIHSLLKLFARAQQMSQQQQAGETTNAFTGFDQTVIQHIMSLFEKVNYPKFTIPDGTLNYKLFGHEVLYLEIKDIMHAMMMRGPHQQQQQGPSFVERLLQKLQRGLVIAKTRSAKLIDLNKVLPTVAGLPLNLTVLVTSSMSLDITGNADVMTFMRRAGPLASKGSLSASVTGEFLGQLDVTLSTFYKVGMRMRLYGVLNAGMSATSDFHMGQQTEHIVKNVRIEFDINNVNNQFKVAHIKSHLYLIHGTVMLETPGDPQYETNYQKCFTKLPYLLTGNRLCRTFVYPNVTESLNHAYFPLSGPFEIDIDLQRADPNVDQFHLEVVYQKSNNTEGHLTDKIGITFSGQGQKLQRRITSMITYDRFHKDLVIDASMPEAQAIYHLRYKHVLGQTSESGTKLYQFIFDEYLQRKSRYLHRMMLQYKKLQTAEEVTNVLTGAVVPGNRTEQDLSVMVAIPAASLHLELYNLKENLASHLVTAMNLTYYCSKSFPLYIFHLNPRHAAQNGDTTRIEFSNDAQFGYRTSGTDPMWSANDNLFIKYPGQTIGVTNTMLANNTNAVRSTDITYLTRQQQQKTIQMKAHVENHTDTINHHYDYFMTLKNGDTYKILFQGHLHGNMRDLNVYTEAYFTKSDQGNTDVDSEDDEFDTSVTEQRGPETSHTCKSVFEWDSWNMTVNFTLKGKPVFVAGSRRPIGGELVWNLDIYYPSCDIYKHFISTGALGRHLNNTLFDFRYWIDARNTHSVHEFQQDNNLQKTSSKTYSLNMNVRYQYHQHMEYELIYTGQRLNGSLEVIYQRQSPFYSEITVHFHADSVWMLLNFDHTELYIISSVNPYSVSELKHYLNISYVLFDLQMNTTINKATGEITLNQDGIFTRKHPEGSSRTDVTTNARMSRMSLPHVTATFSQPSITYIADIGLCHPKELNITFSHEQSDNPQVQELTVLMGIQGSTSMQYTLSWNPDLTRLGLQALKEKKAAIGYMFIEASKTVKMNMQRNLSEMVIPFVNKTVGSVVKRFVAPVLMYLPFKGVLPGNKGNRPQNPLNSDQSQNENMEETHGSSRMVTYSFMKVTSKTLELIGESLLHTPAILRPYFNNVLKPRFLQSLQESHLSFTVPLPFQWKHYMSLPKFTKIQSYVYKLFYGTAHKYVESRQSTSQTHTDVALVYGGGKYIMTFDGRVYYIPLLSGNSASDCTYLLAADFKGRKFALTSSNNGISLIMSLSTITIDFNGRVFHNDCASPMTLPYVTADSAVKATSSPDGSLIVDTDFGLKMFCSRSHHICSISLSDIHHNHSLGLLGTNDGEPGNDLRDSDGTISNSVSGFLTEYALDGPDYCAHSGNEDNNDNVVNSAECDINVLQNQCRELFENKTSLLVTCFDRTSPRPFLKTCLEEAAMCKTNICDHARAYTTLCGLKGLQIAQPSEPVDCSGSDVDVDPVFQRKTPIDMVFVVTDDFIAEHGYKQSLSYMRKLVQTVSDAESKDIKLGIMGYSGGQTQASESGRFFTTMNELVHLPVIWKESVDSLLHNLLEMAARYPFRYNSRKHVILVNKEKTLLLGKHGHLLNVFNTKGIRLHVVSKFHALRGRRVIGMNYDGQLIFTNNRKKTSRLPEGELINLVKQTHGSILDIKPIIDGRKVRMSYIANHLVDNVGLNSCDNDQS